MLLENLHITAEQLHEGMVVAVDKPRQWTSFQVVNKLKWQIKRELDIKKFKIGHAGTLDPLASGLLLICIGPATKQIAALQEGEKRYTGTMVLGATTPCYDLERAVDRLYPVAQLSREALETARRRFLGPQQQTPPHFSAVKVNGQRAYLAAREENEPPQELKSKEVNVYQFAITAFRPATPCWRSPSLGLPDFVPGVPPAVYGSNARPAEAETAETAETAEAAEAPNAECRNAECQSRNAAPPQGKAPKAKSPHGKPELYRHPQGAVPDGLPQIDFLIRCSKGTYIRSIARDYGQALGCGAFLSALRRTQVGDFTVEDAYTIEP